MSAAFPTGLFAKHGILLYEENAVSGLSLINDNPDFGYAVIRVFWRTIEPQKNIYSWTYIQQAIDYVRSNQPGNKVLVQLLVNSFGAGQYRVPQYIYNTNHADYDAAYNGGVIVNDVGGTSLKSWNASVQARHINVLQQIYNQFVNTSEFGGIITTETAVGGVGGTDYNKTNYMTQWKLLCDQKASMPSKLLLLCANFVPQDTSNGASMRELCEYAASVNVGFSPPDVRPNINVLAADSSSNTAFKVIRETSQRFGDGSVPTLIQVQTLRANGSGGYYTPAQLAAYAHDSLGADGVLWQRRQDSPNIGNNFIPNVADAVAAELISDPYPRDWGTGDAPSSSSNISTYQNRVAINLSTGNQDLTHTLGDTPFFGMIRSCLATADGTLTNRAAQSIGFTDGTRQVYLTYQSRNGVSSSTTGDTRGATDAVWGVYAAGTTTLDAEAQHVSWDSSKWVINVNDAPASAAYLLHYFLMSGSDGSSYVNKLSVSTVDVEATLTPGFEPNLILVLGGAGQIDDASDNNYKFNIGIGTWDGSVIRQRGYIQGEVNSTTPTAVGAYITSDYIGGICDGTGVPSAYYELSSVGATTIGITPRNSTVENDLLVVCLKLDNATLNLFDIVTPTSTGITSHDIGIEGELVLALISLLTASDTAFNNGSAGSSVLTVIDETAQYCQGVFIRDNQATSYTRCLIDDKAINIYEHDGTTGIQAAFDSFTGNNLNLNYTEVLASGGVGFGVAVKFTASDTTAPTTPGQPATCTNITQTSMTIGGWTASTDADSGLRDYLLYNDGVLFDTGAPILTNAALDVTGLASNTLYTWTVKARDNAGNISSASTARTATTLSPTDSTPAVFSGVDTATGDDVARTIEVTWQQAVDAITENAQMRYNVYDDSTEGGAFTTLIETTLAGVLGTTIDNAVTGDHWVGVRSLDSSGNEDTNGKLIHVVMSDIAGSYEIETSRPLKLSTNSVLSNTNVEASWVVNGPSGYLADASITDLGTLTTDASGYLTGISVPGPETGELQCKREVDGVIQKWEETITPTVA